MFRKRLHCLNRKIFTAELIDKHCGTFFSLKSALISQPCFSKILKNIFFRHKSNPTAVLDYLFYTDLGIPQSIAKPQYNWSMVGDSSVLNQ